MDYIHLLSLDNEDSERPSETGSESVRTYSAASFQYESEEEQLSTTEGSKVDTNLTSFADLLDVEGRKQSLEKQETVRLVSLKRHIEKVRDDFNIKEQEIQKIREQLNQCRATISNLSYEENKLNENIQRERDNKNIASVGLLEAKLSKLQTELSTEQRLEQTLIESLKQAELVLADAQCKQREFEEISHQLAIDEFLWKREKDAKASERNQKETKLLLNTKRLRKTQEKELLATQQQLDAQSKEAAEKARKAHEDGIRFLRESMDKRRVEEVKEEKKHRVFMENRMNALLELKGDIESSQGSIKALQMLAKHKEMEEQKKMRTEMERVLNEGGNPIEAALWKVKLEQLEKGKESFEKQQKERQLQIVTKLLDEEKIAQRQEQKKTKSHWHTRMGVSHPQTSYRRNKKLPSQKLTIQPKGPTADTTPPTQSDEDDGPVDNGALPATDQSGGDSVLVEPEFRGLWETEQTSKSKNEGDHKHSKMEDEILQTTLDKLRQNIVQKQVAAGREFKGIPFRSKPEEIVFKDLDVGCTYQKKVQLTNVSYTVNFCKLIGISENLQDFITVEFNPPGAMSAGLTCHITVIFQPKLNEDLEGTIEFLAQTGPFHIPVKCYSKKCLISVDKQLVSFGSVCVGEVSRKTVTITNSGALPTSFQLLPTTMSSQQSQISAATPIVTREEPSPQQEELEEGERDGEQVEGQLGGKGSRLSASHVIARSKLYPEGGRPLSKSTSRIGEVVTDNVVTFSNEKDASIAEQPPDIVQSEATLTHSESKSGYVPITVGEHNCGDIGGFSSAVVELLFAPDEVGEYTQQFQLVFSHETVQPVGISAQGKSHDLPIYVDREVMELHTCMLDRLYQDSVILHNRASTALRVTFNVPKSLQPHMEVLPHHGVVQGQSPFSAQLKFLPRSPIFSDCQQFFDEDSMLTAPLEIQIADQVRTVPFKVVALVTVSDLEFNTEQVDFGTCTVHESVVVTVKLTNKSVLPQKFGFIDLPQVIDIQPNDGFGTLLPLETLNIDIIFSANNPKEYNFELKCKSAVDRTFTLPCKGRGILPAVQLSDNIIHFTATPVNATSSTSIIIHNVKFNRLSSARIRQAVPPPGKRAFEFSIPKNCPISLSPSVGLLEPGQKQLIQVEASPKLDPSLVMKEIKRLIALEAEKELLNSQSTLTDNSSVDHPPTASKTPRGSRSRSIRKTSTTSSQQHQLQQQLKQAAESSATKHIEDTKEGSDMWWDASRSLLGDYQDQCFQYCITCYVSSPNSKLSTNEPIEHSKEETLYLEVTLPVIRPSLMIISDHGKDTVDFGDVVNGESVTRTVILKNTGSERLNITSSILDPHGPFHISNAFRKLPPNATHNMLVTFTPTHGTEIFYETLILYYGKGGSLRLGLKGQSIEPDIELSIEDESMDMGDVIANDFITQPFQLTNKSPSMVKYQIKMESTRASTSNYDGHVVFDCVPAEGIIMAGSSNNVNVNFYPDHASVLYNDLARVYISNKERFVIKFTGRAWNTALFIKGGDDTSPMVESLAAVPPRDEDTAEPLKSVFLSFTHFVSQPEKSLLSRTLEICSIKSTLLKKSNGDFTFEPLPAGIAKLFTIDPMKSSVEAGSKKPVTVTFQPPVASNTSTPMIVEANIKVTLKSESVEQYKIILQGRIYE